MVEIHYARLNQEMQDVATVTAYGGLEGLSVEDASILLKNNAPPNYISFDGEGIDLNDMDKQFYSKGDYVGFISSKPSNENCNVSNAGILINYNDGFLNFDNGITLSFYGNCCSQITVRYVFPDTTSEFETLTVNGDLFHFTPRFSDSIHSIEIYFTKTRLPNQFIKLSYIKFCEVVVWKKLKDISLLEEINVLSDDLPINSFDFSVVLKEPFDFQNDDSMNVYSNGKYYGTFFLDTAERTSKNTYSVKALSCIKKLDEVQHLKWTVDGTFSLFVEEAKEDTGIEIMCDNGATYRDFGHIPIDSYRVTLCKKAFAYCLMVDDSRNDCIALKPIPSEIRSVITTSNKRILGESTYTKKAVVTSANMQYANVFEETAETMEFEIPANERMVHYFEEPTEVFDTQPSNITVYSHSGNYVDFISTTANPVLNVFKVKYKHHNIKISNPFASSKKNNEVNFKELNLRGMNYNLENPNLTNTKAEDIKKYIQSGGTIKAKIVLEDEKVGDLIQIETAFDGIKTGIITSMAISFGYRDVADIEVLEWPIG